MTLNILFDPQKRSSLTNTRKVVQKNANKPAFSSTVLNENLNCLTNPFSNFPASAHFNGYLVTKKQSPKTLATIAFLGKSTKERVDYLEDLAQFANEQLQALADGKVVDPQGLLDSMIAKGLLLAEEKPEFIARCREKLHPGASAQDNQYRVVIELTEYLLDKLDQHLGSHGLMIEDIDNPGKMMEIQSGLDLDHIKNPKALKDIVNTVNVLLEASDYNPVKRTFGTNDGKNYQIAVHNRDISGQLKDNYTARDFAELFKHCNKQGTFQLTVHPELGVAKTSDSLVKEMSDRTWITDTCRNLSLMQHKPEHHKFVPVAINTMAHFYKKKEDQFEQVIQNPASYTPYLGLENKEDAFKYTGEINPKVGVAHIFYPNTLDEDPDWGNRRRLESLGLFLKKSCETITHKMGDGGKWGYNSADEIPNDVIDSIANVAKYLQAIDYPYAPSAGNWEEVAIAGGLTWDTEVIKEGYKELKELLFSKKYDNNPEIAKIRKRLQNTKYGRFLSDPKEIDKLIAIGEERVKNHNTAESPALRQQDASLAFVTHSIIPDRNMIGETAIDIVKRNIETLEVLEKQQVRENGVTRYAPFKLTLSDGESLETTDSYLTLGYEIATDKNGKISLQVKEIKDDFGARDCSDPRVFAARAKLSPGDNVTAQWFMVSDISKGYGVQLEKLLQLYQKADCNEQEALMPLIQKVYKKETEYINRGYARITGTHEDGEAVLKANGQECPAYKVPEAYMAVPTIDGKIKFLPGTNSPLAWAQTSLYDASMQYVKNLRTLEKIGLLGQVQN